MSRMDDLVEALYDFAVANPEGFTNADFMAAADIGLPEFNKVARGVRSLLSNDSITLVCDPPEQGGMKWVYRLVGKVEDGSPWVANRLRDAESRFGTLGAVASSLVNATDGRTSEGRRARVMNKAIRRLNEDLAEITQDVS